jgi:Uma2 family endonuclease
MAMSQPAKYWTADDLENLPDDGNRYEVIDGELFVTPAPGDEHQDAALFLARLMADYATAAGLHVRLAPTAVRFSQQREVQPDLVVIPRIAGAKKPPSFKNVGRLELAVEILSPSTARVDRGRKRALYQQERVTEYWLVDFEARTVERWTRESVEPEILRDVLRWQPVADLDPLEIDLIAYFRQIWGD